MSEGGGILAERAAAHEERERVSLGIGGRSSTGGQGAADLTSDPSFRLDVLRLAQQAPGGDTLTAEGVVDRATRYLEFIREKTNG